MMNLFDNQPPKQPDSFGFIKTNQQQQPKPQNSFGFINKQPKPIVAQPVVQTQKGDAFSFISKQNVKQQAPPPKPTNAFGFLG